MTSDVAIRDEYGDHLLTPSNSVVVLIDYQPLQVRSIKSMDPQQMIANVVRVAETARLYDVPIVVSTVNVGTGENTPTIGELSSVLGDIPEIDRTAINAWEDKEFREAVAATGRRKIIMAALWTEACLTFPAIDLMHGGYETYPVVDAVGGTSALAHETALRRLEQSGAHLTTWVQVICELQRDWNRSRTKDGFFDLLFKTGVEA